MPSDSTVTRRAVYDGRFLAAAPAGHALCGAAPAPAPPRPPGDREREMRRATERHDAVGSRAGAEPDGRGRGSDLQRMSARTQSKLHKVGGHESNPHVKFAGHFLKIFTVSNENVNNLDFVKGEGVTYALSKIFIMEVCAGFSLSRRKSCILSRHAELPQRCRPFSGNRHRELTGRRIDESRPNPISVTSNSKQGKY